MSGGPKAAVLRWETDEISLPLPQNADHEAVERIKEVTKEIPIEYSTEIDPRLEQLAHLTRSLLQSEESLEATMTPTTRAPAGS